PHRRSSRRPRPSLGFFLSKGWIANPLKELVAPPSPLRVLCEGEGTYSLVPSPAMSSRRQLPRPLRSPHHGLDQRHAQSAFFQFQNAVDRTSSRRGHFVFQQRRMVSRFEHHLRSAKGRLRRQF